MKLTWPTVQLGDILTERRETPSPDDLALGRIKIVEKISFATGTIQLRVGGETKTGMILIRPGDFVVSGINAAKGAIAVYPVESSEPIAATIHYGAYITNRERVIVEYLWWLLRSRFFRELLLSHVPGGIKTELKAKRLLPVPVPLPPLAEQRRLVARIEELAAQINEARALRQQAAEEAEALWKSELNRRFLPQEPRVHLEELCEAVIDNLHSTPRYDGDAYPCVRSQDVGWGTINYATALRTSAAEFEERTCRGEPKAGDIVFVREGDIGRCAVVDGQARFSLGQRVMILRPAIKRIAPRYMMHALMSGPVLEDQIRTGKTGTTSHHVNIKHLRRVLMSCPSLADQNRITARLDDLRTRLDSLRRQQAETAAELDGLLPSILDKAFKGELLESGVAPIQVSTPEAPAPVASPKPPADCKKTPFRDDAAFVCLLTKELQARGRPTTEYFIQKHTFVAKHRLGLPVNSQFRRKVAGPWSQELKQKAIFAATRTNWLAESGGRCIPARSFDKGLAHAAGVLGDRAGEVAALVADLEKFGENGLERWTTVLKVVEDLKAAGKPVTVAAIQIEIDSWPDKRTKESFTEESVDYTITQMVRRGWIEVQ